METIWKRVVNFPQYQISFDGQLRRNGKLLKPHLDKGGYVEYCLYYKCSQAKRKAHTLVCEAFHGPRPTPKHEVCHRDNDKENNKADNLKWGTKLDNELDKIYRWRKDFRDYDIFLVAIKNSHIPGSQLARAFNRSESLIRAMRNFEGPYGRIPAEEWQHLL